MHVNMLMRLTRVAQEFYCMFYCSCANPINQWSCEVCDAIGQLHHELFPISCL